MKKKPIRNMKVWMIGSKLHWRTYQEKSTSSFGPVLLTPQESTCLSNKMVCTLQGRGGLMGR
jgi:hypothetical protein